MFKDMLLNSAQNRVTRDNTISDGKMQVSYGEMPEIFAAYDRYFHQQGIKDDECLGLVCGNSLAEGLLLLWLLYSKRDTLIIPRGGVTLNLPQFCRNRVSVQLNTPNLDIKSPQTYLNLEPNFESRKEVACPGKGGSIFLRTSGSTAEPKLVLHQHEKFAGNALNCMERFQLTYKDKILIPVPIYHMYGLGAGFLPAVLAGANINLMEQTNIIRYLDRERRFQPNCVFLTPILIEMMLQIRKSPYTYRLTVTAGDRINRATYENFETRFGLLINLYGSTELGAIATSDRNDKLKIRANGIISPLPGVTIFIADHENKKDSSITSEIICSHDYGFHMYVDNKGQTITNETANPFATKDLGKAITKNRIQVAGRTGNSLNRNGILVAYSEVETLLEQGIPEISHAVVTTGHEDNARGKSMIAWCEPKSNIQLPEKELRSRCFNLMPRYMVPDEIKIIPQLPRLPNGKFHRQVLTLNSK